MRYKYNWKKSLLYGKWICKHKTAVLVYQGGLSQWKKSNQPLHDDYSVITCVRTCCFINYDIVCSSCNNGQKWSDKPISAEACKFGEGLTLTMWRPRPFNRHEIWPNVLSGHFAHVVDVVTCPILIMVSQLWHWIQADYARSYWRVFSLVQSLMFTPPSLSSTLFQTARSRFNCKISD